MRCDARPLHEGFVTLRQCAGPSQGQLPGWLPAWLVSVALSESCAKAHQGSWFVDETRADILWHTSPTLRRPWSPDMNSAGVNCPACNPYGTKRALTDDEMDALVFLA